MKNLEVSFNCDASKIVPKAKSANKLLPMQESNAIALSVCTELVEPRTFQEGWNHPDLKQCMQWREAITKNLQT